MKELSILELAEKGGWIMLVLAILSIVAISIFTERFIVIHNAVLNNWLYNPFNIDDGFGSLLFVWKLSYNNPDEYTIIFGVKILAKWVLINEPHFVIEGLCAYIAVPLAIIGAIWYLVAAQAYLARTIRSWKLSKTVFEKSLEGFNQNTPTPPENEAPNPQQ